MNELTKLSTIINDRIKFLRKEDGKWLDNWGQIDNTLKIEALEEVLGDIFDILYPDKGDEDDAI